MGRRTKKFSRSDVQATLTKTRIAPDLLASMDATPTKLAAKAKLADKSTLGVIIEFNRDFPGGIGTARLTLLAAYEKAKNALGLAAVPADYLVAIAAGAPRYDQKLVEAFGPNDTISVRKSMWTDHYVFAELSIATITSLSDWNLPASSDLKDPEGSRKDIPLVYKIWRDHKISRCIYRSVQTVKCDAARITFAASGKGIVWAVADTGVDKTHPHFRLLKTLELEEGLQHKDFTQEHPDNETSQAAALTDQDGHGTHVAGIIAGLTCRAQDLVPGVRSEVAKLTVRSQVRGSDTRLRTVDVEHTEPIAGLARDCKLLSLKVLTKGEDGDLSNLLAAIGYIQKCNDNGRNLKIHGLNLSLGYPFDPEWFAAGQSPLCVEVDRLVRSGVSVVVAAGNGGYGVVAAYSGAGERAAHLGTIADPGNSTLAITVGSTHRDMPHFYGVSYFSAKGPTSDGRMKPDLIAPGERIVSCAVMNDPNGQASEALFREDSGTSMAAPHVSGAIAAFLSVRGEFKGRPEEVKEIILKSATDLKRRPEFQGAGLLDLLRALQSI
ncbi:S8 family peptidase [Bradyrhizobium diazoefficiens]